MILWRALYGLHSSGAWFRAMMTDIIEYAVSTLKSRSYGQDQLPYKMGRNTTRWFCVVLMILFLFSHWLMDSIKGLKKPFRLKGESEMYLGKWKPMLDVVIREVCQDSICQCWGEVGWVRIMTTFQIHYTFCVRVTILVKIHKKKWTFKDVAKEALVEAPTARGPEVGIYCFVDASHDSDKVNQRSQTGFLIFVNKGTSYTLLKLWVKYNWSSVLAKDRTPVKTSTFWSDFTAMKQLWNRLWGFKRLWNVSWGYLGVHWIDQFYVLWQWGSLQEHFDPSFCLEQEDAWTILSLLPWYSGSRNNAYYKRG